MQKGGFSEILYKGSYADRVQWAVCTAATHRFNTISISRQYHNDDAKQDSNSYPIPVLLPILLPILLPVLLPVLPPVLLPILSPVLLRLARRLRSWFLRRRLRSLWWPLPLKSRKLGDPSQLRVAKWNGSGRLAFIELRKPLMIRISKCVRHCLQFWTCLVFK